MTVTWIWWFACIFLYSTVTALVSLHNSRRRGVVVDHCHKYYRGKALLQPTRTTTMHRMVYKMRAVPRSHINWPDKNLVSMSSPLARSRIKCMSDNVGCQRQPGRKFFTKMKTSLPNTSRTSISGTRLSTSSSTTSLDGYDKNSREDVFPTLQKQLEQTHINRTVTFVLHNALEVLRAHGIPEPEASVTHLLSDVLRLPWETGYRQLQQLLDMLPNQSDILTKPTKGFEDENSNNDLSVRIVSSHEAKQLSKWLSRRLKHEPIQYIVGKWDFLDHTYKIRPPLLCPRPETEELVLISEQDIASSISTLDSNHLNILDVGCGTGCIGISLLDRLLRSQRRLASYTSVHMRAIDVDQVAVETSLANAQRILDPNRVVTLSAKSSSSQPILNNTMSSYSAQHVPLQYYDPTPPMRFHFVLSNPPYIPDTDVDTLDKTVVQYESRDALLGGGVDGLNVIRDLIQQLPLWCHHNAICWMEVDPSHPLLLQQWLNDEHAVPGVEYVQSYVDLFGRERFVKLRVADAIATQT